MTTGLKTTLGTLAVACAMFAAAWLAPATTAAATASAGETGTWSATIAADGATVEFRIERTTGRNGHMNASSRVPLAALRGLGASAITGDGTDVRFELVREAGTFSCEGRFKAGDGAGTLS